MDISIHKVEEKCEDNQLFHPHCDACKLEQTYKAQNTISLNQQYLGRIFGTSKMNLSPKVA